MPTTNFAPGTKITKEWLNDVDAGVYEVLPTKAASGDNTDITSITGNAATATTATTATKLVTARTIGGVSFDGSANINLPGVNTPGNQNTSGNASTATRLATDTGSAPSYSCRAWVNFNGTGTVAIRASGNVSSITDNGTGDYTVNFSTAMPDADYVISVTSRLNTTDENYSAHISRGALPTASNCTVSTFNTLTYTRSDHHYVHVAIFR